MFLVLLLALFIAILLEATIIVLPISFVLLLCYSILNRTEKVFLSAFFTGLVLDLFTVRQVGVSSIFFLVFFGLVLLYQRKYEIRSYPFVVVSSFAGSYLYLLLFQEGSWILFSATVSSIIALMIYAIGKHLKKLE